jgi:hypothetical protein
LARAKIDPAGAIDPPHEDTTTDHENGGFSRPDINSPLGSTHSGDSLRSQDLKPSSAGTRRRINKKGAASQGGGIGPRISVMIDKGIIGARLSFDRQAIPATQNLSLWSACGLQHASNPLRLSLHWQEKTSKKKQHDSTAIRLMICPIACHDTSPLPQDRSSSWKGVRVQRLYSVYC